MKKRVLSWILTACMVLSLLPIGALAAPALQQEEEWYDAYQSFILGGRFKQSGQTFGDTKYGESVVSYDYTKFGLFDVDRDGTPELIAYRGAFSRAGQGKYIYTFENHQVRYLSAFGAYETACCYAPGSEYTGLFSIWMQQGCGDCNYFSLKDGAALDEIVYSYAEDVDRSDPNNPVWRGYTYTQRTPDDALNRLARKIYEGYTDYNVTWDYPCIVPMHTLAEIGSMGWDAFVQEFRTLDASLALEHHYVVDRIDQSVTIQNSDPNFWNGIDLIAHHYYDCVKILPEDTQAVRTVNAALKTAAESFLSAKPVADDGSWGSPIPEVTHILENQSVCLTDDIVSICGRDSVFFGGNFTHHYQCVTYDLVTGEKLALPAYLGLSEAETTEMVMQALEDAGYDRTGSYVASYFKNTPVSEYKFYVDLSGAVHVVFNTGEVADYATSYVDVVLPVTCAPRIISCSEPFTGNPGDTETFFVHCYGANLSYLWEYSSDAGSTWQTVGTTRTITHTLGENDNRAMLRCTVSNAVGSAVTGDILLYLNSENARNTVFDWVFDRTNREAYSYLITDSNFPARRRVDCISFSDQIIDSITNLVYRGGDGWRDITTGSVTKDQIKQMLVALIYNADDTVTKAAEMDTNARFADLILTEMKQFAGIADNLGQGADLETAFKNARAAVLTDLEPVEDGGLGELIRLIRQNLKKDLGNDADKLVDGFLEDGAWTSKIESISDVADFVGEGISLASVMLDTIDRLRQLDALATANCYYCEMLQELMKENNAAAVREAAGELYDIINDDRLEQTKYVTEALKNEAEDRALDLALDALASRHPIAKVVRNSTQWSITYANAIFHTGDSGEALRMTIATALCCSGIKSWVMSKNLHAMYCIDNPSSEDKELLESAYASYYSLYLMAMLREYAEGFYQEYCSANNNGNLGELLNTPLYQDYLCSVEASSTIQYFRDRITGIYKDKILDAITVSCPVDVELYDAHGTLLATAEDGKESHQKGGNYQVDVYYSPMTEDYIKVLVFPQNAGYTLRYVSHGLGAVSSTIRSWNEEGMLSAERFDNLPVRSGTVVTVRGLTDETITYEITQPDGSTETKPFVPQGGEAKPATELKLAQTALTMAVGEQKLLQVQILPADAAEQQVFWRSDAESVAAVNGDGVITAKTEGTAVITAQHVNGLKATCTVTVVQRPLPFVDVPDSAYYYAPVAWAVHHDPQVTNGVDATHFAPNANCTRGQMVTFLWRAAGKPAPKSSSNPFRDVKSGAYYYNAVLWAVEKGITNGTSPTTFSPDATVTRAQTVTFLWRMEGEPKEQADNPFRDVSLGEYYGDAVLWAVKNEITNGTSQTTFSPNNPCTRGQIVTLLYRDLAARSTVQPAPENEQPSVTPEKPGTPPTPDVPPAEEPTPDVPPAEEPKPETCRVTFDACGGAASETAREVPLGEAVGALPEAAREGFVFQGWHTAPDGGERVVSAAPMTDRNGCTLYARWTPLAAILDGGSFGDGMAWKLDENGLLVISGAGSMPDYAYKTLGDRPWSPYLDEIKQLIIEEGVTRVGACCFYGCPALTSYGELPESLVQIGEWGFYGCTALTEIEIGPCVERLDDSAFSTCSSLRRAVMSDSVTDCKFSIFFGCDRLTDVRLSENLRKLGDGFFWSAASNGTTDLRRLVIPASVTEVRRAFYNSGVQTIIFCGSAPSFTDDAFQRVTATVWYPKGDPTWEQAIGSTYKGTITWAAYEGSPDQIG